jgi:hypothetical protein
MEKQYSKMKKKFFVTKRSSNNSILQFRRKEGKKFEDETRKSFKDIHKAQKDENVLIYNSFPRVDEKMVYHNRLRRPQT